MQSVTPEPGPRAAPRKFMVDYSYNCRTNLTFVRRMIPRISSAEWDVMNAVWLNSQPTAAQVHASLPPGRRWKQKTVNTFLARLAAKKVLKVTKRGNMNIYSPLLSREECVTSEGDSFLRRVFQGATGPLLLHFCERTELSGDDIKKLKQILRVKGRRR